MTKTRSGLILIGSGIVLNLLIQTVVVLFNLNSVNNISIAGLLVLLMAASVVTALFGVFRLIVGLVSKT